MLLFATTTTAPTSATLPSTTTTTDRATATATATAAKAKAVRRVSIGKTAAVSFQPQEEETERDCNHNYYYHNRSHGTGINNKKPWSLFTSSSLSFFPSISSFFNKFKILPSISNNNSNNNNTKIHKQRQARRSVSMILLSGCFHLFFTKMEQQQRRHYGQVIAVTMLAALLTLSSSNFSNTNSNSYLLVSSSSSRTEKKISYYYSSSSPPFSAATTIPQLPPWMEKYQTWHAQQLRFNASYYPYVVYQCSSKSSGSGRAFCGGIGDRLNGMIQTFYMAMCNRRVFLIDHDTPFSLTTALTPSNSDDDDDPTHSILWNVTYPRPSSSSSHHHHISVPWKATSSEEYMEWNRIVRLNLMDSRNLLLLKEPKLNSYNQFDLHGARGWIVQTNLWMERTMPTSRCLQSLVNNKEYSPSTSSSSTRNPNVKENNNTEENNTNHATSSSNSILDADDLYRWAFHALFRFSDPVLQRARQIQHRTGLFVVVEGGSEQQKNNDENTRGSSLSVSSSSSTTTTTSTATSSTITKWMLQPYVAMHIRTGRGSTWEGDPMRHYGNQTLHHFLACAKYLQQRLMMSYWSHRHHHHHGRSGDDGSEAQQQQQQLPPPLIYIASDNTAVKHQLQEWDTTDEAKNNKQQPSRNSNGVCRITTSTSTSSSTTTNSCIRYDDQMSVIHADKTKDPTLASYLDIWAELVVLMQAKALVMSVSKFSQLAQVLGNFTKDDTARYFDQCYNPKDEMGDNNTTTATTTTATTTNTTTTATEASAVTALTTTRVTPASAHYHRDQVDEKFIEHRKSKTRREQQRGRWLLFSPSTWTWW